MCTAIYLVITYTRSLQCSARRYADDANGLRFLLLSSRSSIQDGQVCELLEYRLPAKALTFLEHNLETHDLALPLPQRSSQAQQEWFRLLLLSPSDIEPASAHIARVERLYHQTGGLNIGIVFLLCDDGSPVNGTYALMNLQLRYVPCNPKHCEWF